MQRALQCAGLLRAALQIRLASSASLSDLQRTAVKAAGARSCSTASLESEEESIDAIRARVFGGHLGNNQRSGRKVLARRLKGHLITDWYFQPEDPPLMHNEDQR